MTKTCQDPDCNQTCQDPDCNQDFTNEEYAVVWIHTGKGLAVRFICLPCSNKPQYRNITEEVTGVKK